LPHERQPQRSFVQYEQAIRQIAPDIGKPRLGVHWRQ
jgi:hypothetical protein